MKAIIKKELKNYFLSPIGYIVIGIFLMAFSTFFYLTTVQAQSVYLTMLFYYTALYGLMFITPLITMWSISGERKSGTEQLIMTAPVSMFGVVLAKFIACMLFIVIPVLCTLMYFGIISYFQMPEIPTYITAVIGFVLLSGTYISFGIFASSLTESPIVSGILSFGFVFASTWIPYFISSLSKLSLMDVFIEFLYGKIDIEAVVLFVSLTVLFIILTMIVMQRRKSVK